ncbi:hypothetical protein GQ42DRAFT_128057 [Ramicandelaber brevisporus]|nr:hypothetical protein GQ42DRAFT_128057 [Ramicandelaber brevisporus]
MHPVLIGIWDRLAKTVEESKKPENAIKPIDQPADLKLQLLPFQREGVAWMVHQEKSSDYSGSILAAEMGMGKTIQAISLMLQEPRKKPNLVVVPMVALMQWRSEISKHTTTLSVLVHHGQKRSTDADELRSYDVVLTTYALLESGFRKQQYGVKKKGELVKEPSLLHSIKWHRIILDEAHNIKDRTCTTARAAFELVSDFRWCLTGTPLQNRVGELYSLLRFIKADPYAMYFCKQCPCRSLHWRFTKYPNATCQECGHGAASHLCWWNQEILGPIQDQGGTGDGLVAFRKLHLLLSQIMLRHTKVERADDLGLPPRIMRVRRDVFNEEEREVYKSLFTNMQRQFNTYIAQGTVLNNYANIFDLITRMRLAANHPDLLTVKLKAPQDAIETLVCALCSDEAEDPIMAKCKHVFCREDVTRFIESAGNAAATCPTCFAKLDIDLSQPALEHPANKTTAATKGAGAGAGGAAPGSAAAECALSSPNSAVYRRSIVNKIDISCWRSSTKIEALVEELVRLRRENATIKSIVFSQFVNFLDLVQWRLNRAGFHVCRLDGRMGPQQREAVINVFMTKHQYTVFLVSLKAGGVALNLTEASNVFICDPWWNPAVELQAADRIHRLGQHRPIRVTNLIIEDSIESRIIELQEKKQTLFDTTIGGDSAALARLSEEDLRFLFVM